MNFIRVRRHGLKTSGSPPAPPPRATHPVAHGPEDPQRPLPQRRRTTPPFSSLPVLDDPTAGSCHNIPAPCPPHKPLGQTSGTSSSSLHAAAVPPSAAGFRLRHRSGASTSTVRSDIGPRCVASHQVELEGSESGSGSDGRDDGRPSRHVAPGLGACMVSGLGAAGTGATDRRAVQGPGVMSAEGSLTGGTQRGEAASGSRPRGGAGGGVLFIRQTRRGASGSGGGPPSLARRRAAAAMGPAVAAAVAAARCAADAAGAGAAGGKGAALAEDLTEAARQGAEPRRESGAAAAAAAAGAPAATSAAPGAPALAALLGRTTRLLPLLTLTLLLGLPLLLTPHQRPLPAAAAPPRPAPRLPWSLPPPQLPLLGLSDAASAAARTVRALASSSTPSPVAAASTSPPPSEDPWLPDSVARVVVIVPRTAASPYRTSWGELLEHTAQRLAWTDPAFQMRVFFEEELQGDSDGSPPDAGSRQRLVEALTSGCQVMLTFGIQDPGVTSWLSSPPVAAALPPTTLALASSLALAALQRMPGGWARPGAAAVSWWSKLLARLPSSPQAQAAKLFQTVQELYSRHNSDDFLFIFLVLINQYVRPVPEVSMTTKGFDLESLRCMAVNCGRQILDCVTDNTCKAGLDCLQACSFNDQVCQYRCIVSHETPKFGAFSLCVLQLHNCRGLDAKPPTRPDPQPMPTFRGAPLTHESAEAMFLGWMQQPSQPPASQAVQAVQGAAVQGGPPAAVQQATDDASAAAAPAAVPTPTLLSSVQAARQAAAGLGSVSPLGTAGTPAVPAPFDSSSSAPAAGVASPMLPFSWLVAAGKNPAYDYFPCQHQLFYRGKAKGTLWYEPVFKVVTLSGEKVWRRRRYRVRRGQLPGTFHFSVLDNGVTSNEFWRILDCDDELEWCLFYYSGAAATAGLSYSGAVLATRTGAMPDASWPRDALPRLQRALAAGGIRMWELSVVDNSACKGAPLGMEAAA